MFKSAVALFAAARRLAKAWKSPRRSVCFSAVEWRRKPKRQNGLDLTSRPK